MSERKLSYVMAFNEAVRQAMEADPEFIGPAALAKAYRFVVGDNADVQIL